MSLVKSKRVKDPAYIKYIYSVPCIACLVSGDYNLSEPHHVNKKGHGSMGSKTDDSRAIPLCRPHHTEIHLIGRDTFALKYSLDYEHIIESLNNIYSNGDNKDV